jgi:ZIP family zinc transporter
VPAWLEALLWGALAGSALLAGAAAGYLGSVPRRVIAYITAFGGGVLVSVLAFDLMQDAYQEAGLGATAFGFLGGGVAFTVASWYLTRSGGANRKRSGSEQPSEAEHPGSGTAIAIGSLLDSVPESMVIGLSLLGGPVSWVTVIGITISNIPEGLSGASGMQQAGRSRRYIFGVWGMIAFLTSLASLIGYSIFGQFSPEITAAVAAVAAGAVLAMLATTMFPEAFAVAHHLTGLITVVGFMLAFWLNKLQERT